MIRTLSSKMDFFLLFDLHPHKMKLYAVTRSSQHLSSCSFASHFFFSRDHFSNLEQQIRNPVWRSKCIAYDISTPDPASSTNSEPSSAQACTGGTQNDREQQTCGEHRADGYPAIA